MGNYYEAFPLRVSEDIIEKMKKIASAHKRSTNKEIEFVLEQYIQDYETQNGELTVDI